MQHHILLGDSYSGLGENDKAIEIYKGALDVSRRGGLPYFKLSQLYNKIGDHEAALLHIDIAMALSPMNQKFAQFHKKIQ